MWTSASGICWRERPGQEHLLSPLLRWDHVREGETVDVGSEEFGGLVDLFAKVLNDGVSRLVSRGLDRDYLAVHEDLRGLKGKLDLATTIKRNLLLNGRPTAPLTS